MRIDRLTTTENIITHETNTHTHINTEKDVWIYAMLTHAVTCLMYESQTHSPV